MYQTRVLSENYFKIFAGVYNNFRSKCASDYKFEIEPLNYDEFIEYFNKKLINCIILLEDDIPTGFLAYSCASSDVIELFLIHILGSENIDEKRDALMENFMLETTQRRKQALVSYPMLGVQTDYRDRAANFGFKFIDLGVMVFDINNKRLIKEIVQLNLYSIPIGYKIVPYSDIYSDELAGVILKSFDESSDINFDVRFGSIEGCRDIVEKITKSVYGRFLSHSSKVLLPGAPMRRVSSLSMFMCTSSSSRLHEKLPASMSFRMSFRPDSMALNSSCESRPALSWARAWAMDLAMSWRKSLQS